MMQAHSTTLLAHVEYLEYSHSSGSYMRHQVETDRLSVEKLFDGKGAGGAVEVEG
jgi:hypothetical protein